MQYCNYFHPICLSTFFLRFFYVAFLFRTFSYVITTKDIAEKFSVRKQSKDQTITTTPHSLLVVNERAHRPRFKLLES